MLLAETSLEQRVVEIVSESLERLGYEVVRVQMRDVGKKRVLQVMIDRVDGANIIVEDCEKASRQISALLDVEDPITDRYDLEVSSPGIDRPLTRVKDFVNYQGHLVKVETKEKIDGRRRFKGTLVDVGDDTISLGGVEMAGANDADVPPVNIVWNNILKAKLELTDALLDASQQTE